MIEERSDSEAPKPLIVYADVREEKSGVPSLIEAEGVPVVRRSLPVADYIVSGEIGIERKTAWDFAKSLFDGRLFEQAQRLTEEFPLVFYIVEGNPARLRRYRARTRQLYAALVALVLDYNVRIIYTDSPEHTAYVIASIAKRLARTGSRKALALRKKQGKLETISDWQLFILESFPNIGGRTAQRIMERFRSIREFCNASKSELASVEGIGEKKAELIFTILNRRFEQQPSKKPRMRTLEDFYFSQDEGEEGS